MLVLRILTADERADHPHAVRFPQSDQVPQWLSTYLGMNTHVCLFGNLNSNGQCVCASGCISARRVCDDPFGRCNSAGKSFGPSKYLILLAVLLSLLNLTSAAPCIDERADRPDTKKVDLIERLDGDITPLPDRPSAPQAHPAQCLYGNWINGNCVCASGFISYRGVCDDVSAPDVFNLYL